MLSIEEISETNNSTIQHRHLAISGKQELCIQKESLSCFYCQYIMRISGQILEVQVNSTENKVLEFVVGNNGIVLPYHSVSTTEYLEFEAPADQYAKSVSAPAKSCGADTCATKTEQLSQKEQSPSTLEQILRGNLDVHIREGGIIEFVKQPAKKSSEAQTVPVSLEKVVPAVQNNYTSVTHSQATVGQQSDCESDTVGKKSVSVSERESVLVPSKEPKDQVIVLSSGDTPLSNTRNQAAIDNISVQTESDLVQVFDIQGNLHHKSNNSKVGDPGSTGNYIEISVAEVPSSTGNHIYPAGNLRGSRELGNQNLIIIQEIVEVRIIHFIIWQDL